MKKPLLLLVIALAGLLPAYGSDLPFLKIRTTDGVTTVMPADGLVFTHGDGNLTVSNGETTAVFALADLDRMYFSPVASADAVTAPADTEVTAYTLGGIAAGTFSSVDEARSSLAPGIYVIKTDGVTFKMDIR